MISAKCHGPMAGYGLCYRLCKATRDSCARLYRRDSTHVTRGRLEQEFQVLLVNAQHIKSVPGPKTNQKDSEWIATLLQ